MAELPRNIKPKLGNKVFSVNYDYSKEIGGLMFGHYYEGNFLEITNILQLKNNCKSDRHYILPNPFLCFIKSLKYLLRGKQLLGEWHSHPSGILKPSKLDSSTMHLKAEKTRNGLYNLGLINDKGDMKVFQFDIKNKVPNGTHRRTNG